MSGIEFLRSVAYWNQVCTCTVLVRTALQKEVGGYKEELPMRATLRCGCGLRCVAWSAT